MSLKMGLLGRKLGMTRVFHDDGTSLGCTALEIGPCVVNSATDAGEAWVRALQLGSRSVHCATCAAPRQALREAEDRADARGAARGSPGVQGCGQFRGGQGGEGRGGLQVGRCRRRVGVSKGKGYQGVMKMHKMAGSVNGHGSHEFFRHGGSIGCRSPPAACTRASGCPSTWGMFAAPPRTWWWSRSSRPQNVVLVKGAVPGPAHGLVFLKGQRQEREEVHRFRCCRLRPSPRTR